MKYYKASVISFLVHGLAFAGSHWMIGQGKVKGIEELCSKPFTLNVQWERPCSEKTEQIPLEAITPAVTKKPSPVKKVKIASKSSPSLENLPTSQEKPQSGNVSLIPYSNNPVPNYPEKARRAGLKGEMMLKLIVNSQGYVADVQIMKGQEVDDCLKQAALETVRKWRFIRSGAGEELISVTLPINFNLET